MVFELFGLHGNDEERDFRQAQQRERELFLGKDNLVAGRDYITIGGVKKPLWSGDGIRLLILGESGSGKTQTERRPFNEVISQMGPNAGSRLLLFDPKGDFLLDVEASGVEHKIIQMDSFYSVRIDFAKEFDRPSDGRRLAELLIPDSAGSSRNSDNSVEVARLLIDALHQAMLKRLSLKRGATWNLFEFLVILLGDTERLRQVLSVDEGIRVIFSRIFGEGAFGQVSAVKATLETHLGGLRQMAMNWAFASKSEVITLKDWVKSDYALVLRHNERLGTSCSTLSRLVLGRAVDRLLQPDTVGRTWVFIDELDLLGKAEAVQRLLAWGRSSGVGVIATSLTLPVLTSVHGETGARRLLGMFNDKVFLRNTDADTLGLIEHIVGPQMVNGKLQSLLPCNPTNGLQGYYAIADYGQLFYHHLKWSEVIEGLPTHAPHTKAKPRGLTEYYLSDFGWIAEMLDKYDVI